MPLGAPTPTTAPPTQQTTKAPAVGPTPAPAATGQSSNPLSPDYQRPYPGQPLPQANPGDIGPWSRIQPGAPSVPAGQQQNQAEIDAWRQGIARPTSQLDALYSLYQQTMYNPQHDALMQQYALGRDAIFNNQDYLARQMGYAQQGYGLDINQLNTKRAMTDIDLRNQGANLPLYDQLAGLRQQYRPLYQQDLDTRLGQINLDETQKHQQAQSAAVSGGFGLAPGVSTGQAQITQDANFNRDAARNQFAKQSLGLDIDATNDSIRKNMEQASYDKLKATAASYGTDAASLYLGLQQKLDSLGMNSQSNVADLFKLMSSTSAADQALAQQVVQQALGAAGNASPQDINNLAARLRGGMVP